MDTTAEILFGKTRRALMLLLFEQPDRCFYIRELSKLSGISPGAVQHELVQLTKAGLLIRKRDGNRVSYPLVFSNHETGFGRADILMFPKQAGLSGKIIEFKRIDDKGDIDNTLDQALAQIDEKAYATQLTEADVINIVKLAIVLQGKRVHVRAKKP